jgi:acyl carrier protein
MDKKQFLIDLAEILEEDVVNENDVLAEFEAWDSLSILSIIAYAQEHYKKQLKNNEIRDLKTVAELIALIEAK